MIGPTTDSRARDYQKKVEGKPDPRSFDGFMYLYRVDQRGNITDHAKTLRSISAAKRIIIREAGKGDAFAQGLLPAIQEWEEKYTFKNLRYLSIEAFDEIWAILEEYYDEKQFTNHFMMSIKSPRDTFYGGTPARWSWEWLFAPGRFNLLIGASGAGKSNAFALIILILAYFRNVAVITNLALFQKTLSKHQNVHYTTYLSEILLIAAKLRSNDPEIRIIVIIDEMATKMNTTNAVIKKREMGILTALMWQMRKLGITFLGIFQDEKDVADKFRTKDDLPGKHSAYIIYKGYRLTLDEKKDEMVIKEFPEGYARLSTMLIRFHDRRKGDVFIRGIENMKGDYNTEETSTIEIDVDVNRIYGDLQRIERAWDENDIPAWRKRFADALMNGMGEWLIDSRSKSEIIAQERGKALKDIKIAHLEKIQERVKTDKNYNWNDGEDEFNEVHGTTHKKDYLQKMLYESQAQRRREASRNSGGNG